MKSLILVATLLASLSAHAELTFADAQKIYQSGREISVDETDLAAKIEKMNCIKVLRKAHFWMESPDDDGRHGYVTSVKKDFTKHRMGGLNVTRRDFLGSFNGRLTVLGDVGESTMMGSSRLVAGSPKAFIRMIDAKNVVALEYLERTTFENLRKAVDGNGYYAANSYVLCELK